MTKRLLREMLINPLNCLETTLVRYYVYHDASEDIEYALQVLDQVPKNNIEEVVLQLLILAIKSVLGTFVDEALPETMERRERCYTPALCYCGKNNMDCVEDGIKYFCKAIFQLHRRCKRMEAIANGLLGVLWSVKSKSVASESKKVLMQPEAFSALKDAERMMRDNNLYIVLHYCLKFAMQKRLSIAFDQGKPLVKLEGGFNVIGYLLLAHFFSSNKKNDEGQEMGFKDDVAFCLSVITAAIRGILTGYQYEKDTKMTISDWVLSVLLREQILNAIDAQYVVIDAALDQSGKWGEGELLRAKAKLRIAFGRLKYAMKAHTFSLAVLEAGKQVHAVSQKLWFYDDSLVIVYSNCEEMKLSDNVATLLGEQVLSITMAVHGKETYHPSVASLANGEGMVIVDVNPFA